MTPRDVRITVRAFTKDGYHKDLYVANAEQTLVTHDVNKVTEPKESVWSGLLGHGCGINPEEFPEMIRFEVVIRSI